MPIRIFKKEWTLWGLPFICLLLLLILAIRVPSLRKNTFLKVNDATDYTSLSKIPSIASLSNEHEVDLSFAFENRPLFSIYLYFKVNSLTGEKPNLDGDIVATLMSGDEELKTVRVPVKELYLRYKTSTITSLKGKEFVFDVDEVENGSYQLFLKGDGVNSDTAIYLLGGEKRPHFFETKKLMDKTKGLMFVVTTKQAEYPYIWYICFLMSVYVLIIIIHFSKRLQGE